MCSLSLSRLPPKPRVWLLVCVFVYGPGKGNADFFLLLLYIAAKPDIIQMPNYTKLITIKNLKTYWTIKGLSEKIKGFSRMADIAWCLALDFRTSPRSPGTWSSLSSSISHLPKGGRKVSERKQKTHRRPSPSSCEQWSFPWKLMTEKLSQIRHQEIMRFVFPFLSGTLSFLLLISLFIFPSPPPTPHSPTPSPAPHPFSSFLSLSSFISHPSPFLFLVIVQKLVSFP